MTNKQLKANIKAIDKEIGEIVTRLPEAQNADEYQGMIEKIDELTKIRDIMSQNKVSDSCKKEIVAGLISVAGMVLVLEYERTHVITSKAFSMATKMFRG